MKEVEIKTKDGIANGYIFYPENKENLTSVILYMDVFGVRDALFQMAQRISEWGYYVLVPNLYYRKARKLSFPTHILADEEKKKEVFAMLQSLTIENIMADTAEYISFLLKQKNTNEKIACTGYCMGGPFSLSAAGNFPDNVVAAASFHGARLATDKPDSPHLLAGKMKAKIYVGIAEIDKGFSDEERIRLEKSLKNNGVDYKTEIYRDARHGFAVPGSAAFDKTASEKHFEVLKSFLAIA